MAQADSISTATGEGVSRTGSTKSTSLRSAHTEPAAALAGNPIHSIESADLDSPADRIDKAFAVLHLDVTALFSDAQQISGRSLNRKHLNKLVVNLQSEPVAVIRKALEELRNHEKWKVS
jgi:hypothetical protein